LFVYLRKGAFRYSWDLWHKARIQKIDFLFAERALALP
jgi:hypothetical protein